MSPARAALSLSTALLLAAAALPARAGDDARADPVRRAWRARAELATRRLAGTGLDACDRGLEQAFQRADERTSGTTRNFFLEIRVGDDRMLVAYQYEGERLDAFGIVFLPERWVAYQNAESKTLTVLLGLDGTKCAFDLCTNDPLADGRCPEPRSR